MVEGIQGRAALSSRPRAFASLGCTDLLSQAFNPLQPLPNLQKHTHCQPNYVKREAPVQWLTMS